MTRDQLAGKRERLREELEATRAEVPSASGSGRSGRIDRILSELADLENALAAHDDPVIAVVEPALTSDG